MAEEPDSISDITELRKYIDLEAHNLHETLKAYREIYQNLLFRYNSLKRLEQQYPHLFQREDEAIGAIDWLEFVGEDLDPKGLIEQIDNLTLEGDNVRFFSEEKLYDLLGKEDARKVLGLMRKIQKFIRSNG